MKPGRIPCCIPGCGRSWKDDGENYEIICGRHMKMSPASTRNRWKRVRASIFAQLRRNPENRDHKRLRRLRRLHALLWQRIKANATPSEKPEGIAAFLDEMGLR